MQKRIAFGIALAAAMTIGGMASAQLVNPVLDAQLARAKKAMPENRTKVRAAWNASPLVVEGQRKADASVAWFAVPAMSDRMRLMDTYPVDGRIGGEVRVVVAKDEFEPASFQLFAFQDYPEVQLSVGALKNENGTTLQEKDVDLRVVKVWLQNGNGWQSYFSDVGLMMVPELALHDEKMVKVDLKKQANYARLKDENGERFVWISAPKEIAAGSFDPVKDPFGDAEMLQPVELQRDAFKQFLLTIHAPKNQQPGVYRGNISVTSKGEKLAEIPVAVRVLPFELPVPRPYNDLDGYYIVSFMGAPNKGHFAHRKDGLEMYKKCLASMRDHGIAYPAVRQDKEHFDILRELGMPTEPMIGHGFLHWFGLNFGGRMGFNRMMEAKNGAEKSSKFYQENLGHNNILVGYGDEQGAAFVAAHRNFFRYYEAKGMLVGCAGHSPLLTKGGHLYGYSPMGTHPNNRDYIRKWKEAGATYQSFYATQHNGSENPQFVRMQHGLLGYFAGINMVYNYEFALGPWNDMQNILYKPMVLSYLNSTGLMESLPYSGFREGVDDVRYATYLLQMVKESESSKDGDVRVMGRKARLFLALLEHEKMDLNAVRAEMIEHIMKLRKALGK